MNSTVIRKGQGFERSVAVKSTMTFHRGPQARYRLHPLVDSYVETLGVTPSIRKSITRSQKFTIDFLIVMQVSKGVKIHITMERHMWPVGTSDMAVCTSS